MTVSDATRQAGLLDPPAPPRSAEDLDAGRTRFLLRLSRTVSSLQHPARAAEAVVGLLTDELVAFAQVTLLSGRQEITTSAVVGGPASSLTGHRSSATHEVLGEVEGLRTVQDRALPPSGPERAAAIRALVTDPAVADALDDLGPESVLLLPLCARGRCFGVLAVAREAGLGLDETATGFLVDTAGRVSQCLDAALAVAESRHVSAVLRRSMAPAAIPHYPHLDVACFFQISSQNDELGGDFYDLHGPDDDLVVLLGDVAGTGVEAVLHAKRIRNAVRTSALIERDPAWILGVVNSVLSSDAEIDSELLATAVCARLTMVGDELHVRAAVAGHPPALVLRSGGGIEVVPGTGPALGLLETATYAETSVVLRDRDTLVLYTDGVTEARGHEDRFGYQRLLAVLEQLGGAPASAVVDLVAAEVTDHLRGRRQDDITLLALRHRSAAS